MKKHYDSSKAARGALQMEGASSVKVAQHERSYMARDLVDLALKGHFCIRETIHSAIHEIYRRQGSRGRERMNDLGNLREYASEEEIDAWQKNLLALLEEIRVETKVPSMEIEGQLPLFGEK